MTWTNAVTFFERKLINIFRRLSISVRNKVQILIILYKLILIILYTLILISYYYGMRQYNMCVKVFLCYNILYSLSSRMSINQTKFQTFKCLWFWITYRFSGKTTGVPLSTNILDSHDSLKNTSAAGEWMYLGYCSVILYTYRNL